MAPLLFFVRMLWNAAWPLRKMEIPVQRNSYLTFLEAVRQLQNQVIHENIFPLNILDAAPPCDGKQGGQGKRWRDLKNVKKHYHLMRIFDKIKPLRLWAYPTCFL